MLSGRHADYLALLARWNHTINLTGLEVDPADEAAIERVAWSQRGTRRPQSEQLSIARWGPDSRPARGRRIYQP